MNRLLALESGGLDDQLRRQRVRNAARLACKSNTTTLDWWMTKYLSLTEANVKQIVEVSIDNERIPVLNWLERRGVLPRDLVQICSHAASAYWLHSRGYSIWVYIDNEIESGNLEFLKWCYDHRDTHTILDLDKCIVQAALFSNVEIAQWLIDSYPDAQWEEPTHLGLVECSLEMIKWFENTFRWSQQVDESQECAHKRWVNHVMERATKNGQLDIVQYLYDHPLHEPS